MFCALIHLGTPSEIQKLNTANLLMAKQPSDNLGLYWYLMSEMFLDRLPFFRYVLLIMQLATCLFVSILLWSLADVLDWGAELGVEPKGQRTVIDRIKA